MPRWGMVIDLDRCTGCGACVAACKNENNVAVGPPEWSREGRSMFWMEILKTEQGDRTDERVSFIPRPCFHCGDPPCTRVCPVRATYRSEEGLVAQIYPRCIGCRYCMVACPYTVKVFNWHEPQWTPQRREGVNPDVSLRFKGVVEKCTFCSHRLQAARERARAEDRPLREDDYRTSCQDVCPTRAIAFGDLHDPSTAVARWRQSPRAIRLLEDLGTEPMVYYLSRGE